MNKIIILLCMIFLSDRVKSQSYSNIRVNQDGLSINIVYDMNGKLKRGDQVALTYSIDNGYNYIFVNDAGGDIGLNILAEKDNEIHWSVIDKNYIIDHVIQLD